MHPPPQRGVTALHRPACAQLFVIFQGGTGTLMMDPTEFMREAQLVDRNLFMLRDQRFTWFLRDIADNIPDSESLVGYIRRIRDLISPKEVYFIGTCMGAWAAMYYAHRVGANEVWAFAPNPPSETHAANLRTYGIEPPDLSKILKEDGATINYHVYYCENSKEDRSFVETLVGCPGVTLNAVPGDTHRVLAVLQEQGKLKRMFPALRPKS